MSRPHEHDGAQRAPEAKAAWTTMRADRRFLWFWLCVATSLSVGGNVGHAWLTVAAGPSRWMAIGWAVAPPILLMLAIHGLPTLARMLGRAERDKVLTAVVWGVTLGAFGWSAFGIFGFTTAMGVPAEMAWVAPFVIDLSVFGATRGLVLTAPIAARMKAAITSGLIESVSPPDVLPLQPSAPSSSTPQIANGLPANAGHNDRATRDSLASRKADNSSPQAPRDSSAVLLASSQRDHAAGGGDVGPRFRERPLSAVPAARPPSRGEAESATDDRNPVAEPAAAQRWHPVAESLVRDGVTSKHPQLVAKILAEHAAGTAPSTIGRRHEVHHTTVNRILSAAEQRVEASTSTG